MLIKNNENSEAQFRMEERERGSGIKVELENDRQERVQEEEIVLIT